jgi:hypothetical protein
MKNGWYILSMVCTLISCNHSNKTIEEKITNSDSLAINYYKGDGSIDSVVAVIIVRDRQKIKQLAKLISDRSVAGDYKCGYDGSLHFFKMNSVIQDIDFTMNRGDCVYFSFLLNNKSQATALSATAKELINSFRK